VANDWSRLQAHVALTVRSHRLAADLSQLELARRADVSLRRIQQIEVAEENANPSLRVLQRIAAALGTTIAVLIGGDPAAGSRTRSSKRRR
jgi:transcriptional regulator with XRE-family HTH domain